MRFCGARRVRIAACETVTLFNIGEASKAFIMELRCLSYKHYERMKFGTSWFIRMRIARTLLLTG
jgi:hypothetical protein